MIPSSQKKKITLCELLHLLQSQFQRIMKLKLQFHILQKMEEKQNKSNGSSKTFIINNSSIFFDRLNLRKAEKEKTNQKLLKNYSTQFYKNVVNKLLSLNEQKLTLKKAMIISDKEISMSKKEEPKFFFKNNISSVYEAEAQTSKKLKESRYLTEQKDEGMLEGSDIKKQLNSINNYMFHRDEKERKEIRFKLGRCIPLEDQPDFNNRISNSSQESTERYIQDILKLKDIESKRNIPSKNYANLRKYQKYPVTFDYDAKQITIKKNAKINQDFMKKRVFAKVSSLVKIEKSQVKTVYIESNNIQRLKTTLNQIRLENPISHILQKRYSKLALNNYAAGVTLSNPKQESFESVQKSRKKIPLAIDLFR